ncbi:DUF3732 domain-containing protein [Alloalcanivorax venustensis]|uniref:DUF3732 domain-containing protein n=1 Tax=Alloalcanivorax venustensis TaxID=172371 RepID=UPI00351864BB
MNRWNIEEILFYGQNDRRVKIKFDTRSLNIITGESATGKSVLLRVVDYCLGASTCQIQKHVKDHCLAVGILWSNGEHTLFTGRDIPRRGKSHCEKCYIIRDCLASPAKHSDLHGNTSRSTAKELIETYFGIDELTIDERDSAPGLKVSIRHLTPYMFMPGSTLINESTLIYGLDDPKKSKHILQTVEYATGVLDGKTMRAKSKLKQLKEAREAQRRKLERIRQKQDDANIEAARLFTEAIEVGMISSETEEISLHNIKKIANWTPGSSLKSDGSELESLFEESERIIAQISEAKSRYRLAKRYHNDAINFGDSIEAQKHRLQYVELFDDIILDDNCPLCGNLSEKPSEILDGVRSAFKKVTIQQDYNHAIPSRIGRSLELEDSRINSLLKQKEVIDNRIESIISEREKERRIIRQRDRATHISGRASYFLETVEESQSEKAEQQLKATEARLEELSALWNESLHEEKLRFIETSISNSATEILSKLPSKSPLSGARIQFNLKSLTASIWPNDNERVDIGAIGSDQNYLSLHLAVILALHRNFIKNSSPVPSVIFVDQVSRPYYPREDHHKIINNPEVKPLKETIDALFNEITKNKGIQIILLEHAYFSSDPRYVAATKAQWGEEYGGGLIPDDWPLVG